MRACVRAVLREFANLTGVFLMTKHCVPRLRAARGAVVQEGSRAASGRTRRARRRHRFIADGGMTREMIYV